MPTPAVGAHGMRPLQRAGVAEDAPPGPPLQEMPTQSKALTTEPTIMGPFQYMAPEQLEGKEAARRNIFAPLAPELSATS